MPAGRGMGNMPPPMMRGQAQPAMFPPGMGPPGMRPPGFGAPRQSDPSLAAILC